MSPPLPTLSTAPGLLVQAEVLLSRLTGPVPRLAGWMWGLAALAAVLLLVLARAGLSRWTNHWAPRLGGTLLRPQQHRFPLRRVPLGRPVRDRPAGSVFLGLGWRRGLRRWRPVHLDLGQRSMHTQVIGKTGSGKTQGVLFPLIWQDLLDGRGVVLLDAKGSDENARTLCALARAAGRWEELRLLNLAAWNRRGLPTHRYNLLRVRPRTPTDSEGGDPMAAAERVFSILPVGDHPYYRTQAEVAFRSLVRVLHGLVDAGGHGLAFTLEDVRTCLLLPEALAWCLERTVDRAAAFDLHHQLERLGKDVAATFSGLLAAMEVFASPLVNDPAPGLDLEAALEEGLVVYAQLPTNLFRQQGPALGRALLMDLQQQGSLRQVERTTRSQRPVSVYLDEFAEFADLPFIASLNKLRDAHLHFTLAHQSLADLELVSPAFATAVWDNTRTKVILRQDDPALCERLARSVGTRQTVELTVRRRPGVLFTTRPTGEASSRLVDSYVLHPNAIKSLAPAGQAWTVRDGEVTPVCLPRLAPVEGALRLPVLAPRPQAPVLGLRDRFMGEAWPEEAASFSSTSP